MYLTKELEDAVFAVFEHLRRLRKNGWAQRFGVGVDGEHETPPPGYRPRQRHLHPVRRYLGERERRLLSLLSPARTEYP